MVRGQLSVGLTEASVLVNDAVDLDLLQEVGEDPLLHEVDVLCVAVGEDYCVLGVAIYVDEGQFGAAFRVELDVVRVHREATDRWLEHYFGVNGAHFYIFLRYITT